MEEDNENRVPQRRGGVYYPDIVEQFEEARLSPFLRKLTINSFKKEIAKKSAERFFLAWFILSVALPWTGDLLGNELITHAGLGLGLLFIFLLIMGMILFMINVDIEKCLIPLFSRFPGNGKMKFYIRELEKIESQ